MTELSYSQLTLHRRCAQAFYYRYVERLDTLEDTPQVLREFGSWWHAVLAVDSIVRGEEAGTLQFKPEVIHTVDGAPEISTEDPSVSEVFEAARDWWRTLNPAAQEEWAEKLGEDMPTRLLRLWTAYNFRWAEEMTREHPLAVELKWERTLPVRDGEAQHVLIGFIDEVYWDTRRRMVVVRDHKTNKAIDASSSLNDMMDSQLQFYAWGASPIIESWGKGPVRATAYNRSRSVSPKSPQVTTTGLLSKSVTDYDLDTYERWAAGPDGKGVPWGEPDAYFVSGKRKGEPKFGLYTAEASVIEKLSSPAARAVWFDRTLTPLNKTLIQSHLVAAVDTASDIDRTRARGEDHGEAARNLSKNCGFCEYQSLCRAQMMGGPRGDYDLAEHGLRRKPARV